MGRPLADERTGGVARAARALLAEMDPGGARAPSFPENRRAAGGTERQHFGAGYDE